MEKIIKAYAFVESISGPDQKASQYGRANVVLDVIFEEAFNSGRGILREPKDLAIVRIMSTAKRLMSRFRTGEITDGKWFRVHFQAKTGEPPVWILGAEDAYSGGAQKSNLIEMQPLVESRLAAQQTRELADLTALCAPAEVQLRQPVQRGLPRVLKNRYFVRVVDVGHASFSAIHTSQDASADILGYFDVGGACFLSPSHIPKELRRSRPNSR